MTAPYDRPAHGEPGGCECFTCGRIFIGAPWHTECAVCFASGMEAPSGVETTGSTEGDSPTAESGDAQNTSESIERTVKHDR